MANGSLRLRIRRPRSPNAVLSRLSHAGLHGLALLFILVHNVMYKICRPEVVMAEMVRNQIYVHKRARADTQAAFSARRVSEAEIIRQALEREATGEKGFPHLLTRAWGSPGLVNARKALRTRGRPYRWNRQECLVARRNASTDATPMIRHAARLIDTTTGDLYITINLPSRLKRNAYSSIWN